MTDIKFSINTKKSTDRHILFQLQKSKDKENSLKWGDDEITLPLEEQG